MEKPVRRKASFARYNAEGKQIKGHKSAQSSGSGAGAWMGKGKAIGGKEDTVQVETKDGRKYHIPATAAAAAIRATDVQKQMIAKKDLQPSESGDVDLDLSFDFVSKMERGKKIDNNIQLEKENFTTPSTPPRRDLIDGEKNTTPIPKGMSSTDWGSRQRKKPPTPLSLGRKRESMENGRDLASQFSPDSPTIKTTNYDDEPLMIVPISATRRANDAGILSTLDSVTPTAMESNNAAMTNLIHQQRMAASKRQNVSQTSLSKKSPGKRKKVPKAEHSSPKKSVFAESSTKLGQKVPFGTNQRANNAQIARAEESRLFFDGRSEDVHSKSYGHSTDSEERTSYTTSSYYHSNESQGRRSRQLSARESIGSSNHSMPASFKTAATQEAESSAGHAAFSNSSPSAQNVLGLLFPADNVPAVPRIETTAPATHTTNSERSDASPMLTQKSTPLTPYSPLFSDGGNADSHGHSSSLSSTGGRTPLTAVSTLFGDRTGEQDGKLKTESTSILRGSTTPNPISSIATEVIREESSLSIDRPISVHPSDSIKMQDGHELQLRTSIETDESLPSEQRKNLIVNTDPSPRKNQDSFDLTDITGTRAKKGPWSQSPLLLESDDQSKNRVSSMIGENDAEMGFGLGLSLLGERDPEKFSKHPQDHSLVDNLAVNRAEISHESSNAIGLDLVPMHTNEKDRKFLTKSPSTSSSTFEGFSINVTPAIEKKEGIKTPDHRVDVPSNVVDIEEILAAGNNAESRGRWSSKLWSVTSAFRSPIRSSFDFNNSTQSPPMRALTLVGKNKDGTSKSSSIRRSASREDLKSALSKQQGIEESPAVDVYHSMPSSSVLNEQATFSNETVTRPAAAMYTEARSSKHVKRASRIQYLKSGGEESHVQVDMEKNNAMERAILDMIKSPRVAGPNDLACSIKNKPSLSTIHPPINQSQGMNKNPAKNKV